MEYGFYNYPSTEYHILKKPQTANNNYTSQNKEYMSDYTLWY